MRFAPLAVPGRPPDRIGSPSLKRRPSRPRSSQASRRRPNSADAAKIISARPPVRRGVAGHQRAGRNPECVWLGRPHGAPDVVNDDLDTAFRHLDLYDRFGCPGGHIQATFRCLTRFGAGNRLQRCRSRLIDAFMPVDQSQRPATGPPRSPNLHRPSTPVRRLQRPPDGLADTCGRARQITLNAAEQSEIFRV